MREYARYEYAKEKCPICGCRNKVFTPVYDDDACNCDRCKCGEREAFNVGFQLKCCNCGFVRVYRTSYLHNGDPLRSEKDLVRGRDVCFQPSPCPHKNCPLYGTCPDFWGTYGKDGSDWKKLKKAESTNNSNRIETNTVSIELVENEKFR